MAGVMGARWHRRVVGAATVVVLLASAAWWYRWASGPHRVAAIVGATVPAASEYLYTEPGPSHSASCVRPVVEHYIRSVPKGARVLDLGCGNGWPLASFADRGWERFGLDVTTPSVRSAPAVVSSSARRITAT